MNEPNQIPAQRFICRCEEVTDEIVDAALAEGARTVNDVKRRTRAGMGLCQGVYCLSHIAEVIRVRSGHVDEPVAPMTARPPVRGISLADLGRLRGPE